MNHVKVHTIKKLAFILILLSNIEVFAKNDTITIRGSVIDQNDDPINNVIVEIEETGNSVMTNTEGEYAIKALLKQTLIFTKGGKIPLTKKIKSKKNINVILKGRKEKDLSVVKNRVSKSEMGELMLIISKNSLQRSDKGVIVRGEGGFGSSSNEPLLILNGAPIEMDTFNTINLDEITDIKILKSASETSIYGMRGANGVILITTK